MEDLNSKKGSKVSEPLAFVEGALYKMSTTDLTKSTKPTE